MIIRPLIAILLLSACQVEPPPDEDLLPAVGGGPGTGARELRDRDGDGVADERDRCETPRLPHTDGQGRFARHVSADDGCDEAILPRVCHGDTAPPRMVLGNEPAGHFVNGATVRILQLDGRWALGFSMSSAQDADIVEDCPDMATYMFGIVRIGMHFRTWTCEGREQKLVQQLSSGPEVIRQIRMDQGNPCVFDPALVGVDDTTMLQALSSSDVQVLLLFQAKDGVGNILTTNLGDGVLGGNVCGFSTTRDDYDQVATVVPGSCAGICGAAPSVALGPSQVIVPPIPPGLSGPTIVLADAPLTIRQVVNVAAAQSCSAPVVSGAVGLLRAGEELLVDQAGSAGVLSSLPCTAAAGPGAGQVTLTCTVQPPLLSFTPGADAVIADLTLVVRSDQQVVTREVSIMHPL
ncbi:MAG TPA: hypothetical protein VNO33_09245 [Kofleriaceae bacterium]|nr:hypothetical protein [Kofleriaceae bacterium]